MSKIGNYRIAVQESDDYRFGWESAERGEPPPFSALTGCFEEPFCATHLKMTLNELVMVAWG